MFSYHLIRMKDNEEILFLFMDTPYQNEFGIDFFKIQEKTYHVYSAVKRYIKDHMLNFNGHKVYFVSGGNVIGSLLLNNNYTPDLPIKRNYKTNKDTLTDLDNQVIIILTSDIKDDLEIEALKAIAVVIRTNLVNQPNNRKIKRKFLSTNIQEFKMAVTETSNQYITYNQKIIKAPYHQINNGKTENSFEILEKPRPYLISINSPYDKRAKNYNSTIIKDSNLVMALLGIPLSKDTKMEIVKTEAGYIKQIKFDNHVFSGNDLKNLLNLPSNDFDIKINEQEIIFNARGQGLALGLSIFGANELAKRKWTYQQIINYYYPKTSIQVLK